MANQNDYVIPFGVDPKGFFDGIKAMDSSIDSLAANSVDAGKQIQKGFEASAQAGDKLNRTLLITAEESAQLATQARTLGKDLGAALSGKNVGGDLEKRLGTFSTLMQRFSTQANKKITFNVDAAKLQEFERILENGITDLKEINTVIDFTKQQLAQLDPNSEEFAALNQQLQIAEQFMAGLGEVTGQTDAKQKSLKTQLREMKVALAEMELAGKGDTEEFRKMSIAAGQLEDQIGDVSARVRVLASDTKYIDAGVQAVTGLAGAFTAAQGAAALFGGESEEVQKVIQRVTGAMAVLQGIQAVANALNKDSALSVLLLGRRQQALAVSTSAAAAATGAQATATVGAAAATRTWTAALLANPIFLLLGVVTAVTAALLAFTGGQSDAERATQDLNDALQRQTDLLEADEADLRRRTALNVARAKAAGQVESDITTIEGKAINERIELRRRNIEELSKLYNDDFNRRNRSAEDDKKLFDQIAKEREALDDAINEAQIKLIDRNKQRDDEEKERLKKGLEEQKKAAEERKKIIEQELKFTNELAQARIESIKDETEREKAEVRRRTAERIGQLQNEVILSADAGIRRTQLITQLRKNEIEELKKLDQKAIEERAALQLQADSLVADLLEESAQKEIELTRIKYIEKRRQIEEQYKNEADLRARLIAVLNDAEAAELEKSAKKRELDELTRAEEREILETEIALGLMQQSKALEEQKQIEILRIKLKYAEETLNTLIEQGNAENSVVVLQAKKTVVELNNALAQAIEENKGKSFSMFDVLGLGDLTDQQKDAVTSAVKASLQAVTEITDFIIDQYQRQIDKRQEVIDQIDESIEELEDQQERERELKEQGFANDFGLLQAEIDEKKRLRDEQVKEQEELQRKQRAAQRAQLILDTALQAQNLITASTEIFKSLAGIPFVGIPLAIATIALMTGAFVAAKVKAFQLVNQGGGQQSFGEGGYVDGKPHSQGGKKYYAPGGDVVELESGEFVASKKATDKYGELLEAINDDRLSGMNDRALKDMLAGLGVHFDTDAGADVLKDARARDEFKEKVMILQPASDIDGLEEIAGDVRFLAESKRKAIDRWEDEDFFYTREGNTTKKIPKRKK